MTMPPIQSMIVAEVEPWRMFLLFHEGFRDGHVRFDKACGDCLDYQLAGGEKGDELGAVVKDE